jgi:hypothetical protein
MLGAQPEDHPIFLQNHAVETQMLDDVPELQFSRSTYQDKHIRTL